MDQKEIFSRNLNRWLKLKGKTQADLVSDLDLKIATVSDWCNGKKYPRIDKIQLLADYLKILKSDLIEESNTNNNSKLKTNKIPVLGSIPAGIPIELIEDILDYEEISEEMLKGDKEYFALRVKGNSMEPKYLDGDTLIILKTNDCESGQDCIVMVNGDDGTFKRVIKTSNGIALQPLNPNYEMKFYSNEEVEKLPIRILGIVKEIRRTV